MGLKEPTIEEAINDAISDLKCHRFNRAVITHDDCDLAIRALEEMRDKENFQPIVRVAGPKEVWVTTDGKKYRRCKLAEEDFDIDLILPFPNPHPRTWDTVTLGEVARHYSDVKPRLACENQKYKWYFPLEIVGKQVIEKTKSEPPSTWRSMGDPHGFGGRMI